MTGQVTILPDVSLGGIRGSSSPRPRALYISEQPDPTVNAIITRSGDAGWAGRLRPGVCVVG